MEPPSNESQNTQTPSEYFGIEPIKFNVDNKLPFAYFSAKDEGKTRWICNYGRQPGTIVGVFIHEENGQKHRDDKFLTMAEAITIKDGLIKEGWLPLDPPKIEFTVNGEKKSLNRKQKRYIARKVKTLAKDQK